MTGQMLDFLGWFARPISLSSIRQLFSNESRTMIHLPVSTVSIILRRCTVVTECKQHPNSKRYCCGPMAGLVFKWNTCPFASSSHHHLLLFSFFPGDSGAGDRRGSSVPVVRRQLLRIPASPVEVSPFFKKKTMSFEPLYFPTLVIVVVKHLTRNTHERKFPPLPFVFLLVKNTFGRSSNDRTAKTTTQMEMAVVAYPLCAHVFQLT